MNNTIIKLNTLYDLNLKTIRKLSGGLINSSFLAQSGDSFYVVQKINTGIFPPEVSDDVASVTSYLRMKDFPSFDVVADKHGNYHVETETGSWRILTFVPGKFPEREKHIEICAEALGRFHSALSDFKQKFKQHRNIHSPARYASFLRETLKRNKQHSYFERVASESGHVLEVLDKSPDFNSFPQRVVHGDPKLENFLIHENTVYLVDLDTVGRRDILGEMGDALRSWCNKDGIFDFNYYARFTKAYCSSFELTENESVLLPESVKIISYELSARFLADTLNENYFGWDMEKYGRAAAHNWERSKNALKFARSINF